ncbi:MAG: glycosyltransferase, partial [Terriglobales bacterium]
LGLAAARRCRLPTAWFLRGFTGEDWKVRAFERLDRHFLPRADRAVCLSELQAGRVAALGIARDRLRVVPNTVEPPASGRAQARRELQSRLGVAPEALLVGAAGRLSPEKGAAEFLDAIAALTPPPQTCFLIFGEGPLRAELEAQRARLGLDRVQFAGFQADFPSLLPGLDLLVNPSRTEEMPNVVMEAMAAGVAVVATAVGGVPEIAGDPPALRLVPARDPAAMAAAIAELLGDAEARRRLAAAGRERIASAFSPARQRACLQALYAEFIK